MNTHQTLSALAEPNRLRIVEMLRDEPSSVGDIATRLVIRQPQVSKHLRVLAQAGLVMAKPRAQLRIYELQPGGFADLDEWLGSFRSLWEKRYRRLDALLAERVKAARQAAPEGPVSKSTTNRRRRNRPKKRKRQ